MSAKFDKQALGELRDALDNALDKEREARDNRMRVEYDAVRYLVDHCNGQGLKLDRNWLNAVTRS